MTEIGELLERVLAGIQDGYNEGEDEAYCSPTDRCGSCVGCEAVVALSRLKARLLAAEGALQTAEAAMLVDIRARQDAERERDELRAILPETAIQTTKARIARVAELEEALREIADRPLIYGSVPAEICRDALEAKEEK